MKDKLLQAALVAALMLCSYQPLAAGKEPDAATKTKPAAQAKQGGKPAAKVLDINSAGKAELKTLPGIGDAEAAKIVAGRPYRSKSNLVTRNIIPQDVYEGLKRNIMAKPK